MVPPPSGADFAALLREDSRVRLSTHDPLPDKSLRGDTGFVTR